MTLNILSETFPLSKTCLQIPRYEKLVYNFHMRGVIKRLDTPVQCNSGRLTRTYVEARKSLTLYPQLLTDVGMLIAAATRSVCTREDKRTPCLIGVPHAGQPLATSATACQRYGEIASLTMRTSPKNHGGYRSWVDDTPRHNEYRYGLVDNAMNSGASFLKATAYLRGSGFDTKELFHIVLVDRCEGGEERLWKHGYAVTALFRLPDLIDTFGDMGLWTASEVSAYYGERAAP